MSKRCLILLSIIELLAIGCHHSPYQQAHLELLNAEKRALEDQFYSLEFEYEDALREIEKLKQQSGRQKGSSDASGSDTIRSAPRGRGSSSSPGRNSAGSKTELAPPMIEEGMLSEPKIEMGPPPQTPEPRKQDVPLPKSNTAPRKESAPAPMPPSVPNRSSANPPEQKSTSDTEVPTRILTLDPADPRVTHLFLNPLLTGGTDFDHQPGDDGLVVVIEPRNRDDAFVPLAGPVSVLVVDPEKSAEQGRVLARWDVDAAEAQRLMVNSPNVRGIQLRLPWPATAPQTSRLQLHVRYMTLDHRDLRAERELFITLPGQFSQRWTPRASRPSAGISVNSPLESGSKPATELAAQRPAQSNRESANAKKIKSEVAAPLAPPTSGPATTARPEWRPYR